MKKIMILCLLLLGIGLAGLQAQQRIKVKRLPIDTYEAVGEDEEDFEEPTGADFGTARIGETTDTDEPSSADAEDKEGEDSGEKANPKCPNPDGTNARMASSEDCDEEKCKPLKNAAWEEFHKLEAIRIKLKWAVVEIKELVEQYKDCDWQMTNIQGGSISKVVECRNKTMKEIRDARLKQELLQNDYNQQKRIMEEALKKYLECKKNK